MSSKGGKLNSRSGTPKSRTLRSSVSPTSADSKSNNPSNFPVFNNFQQPGVTKDMNSLHIFLESLDAWLNGYFFTKLALSQTQLPRVPYLENYRDTTEICEKLRTTIGNIREEATHKINQAEENYRNLSYEFKMLEKNNMQLKTQMLRASIGKESKESGSPLKIQDDYSKMQSEVEFLHNEIVTACNSLQVAFDEVQRQGYKKPKRKLESIKNYAAEAKFLIISLTKD